MSNNIRRYEVADKSNLERIADRMEAGGVAESVLAQLDTEMPLDAEKLRPVMGKSAEMILLILDPSLSLERMVSVTERSLFAEKKLNLDLKVTNRHLVERNAEMAKEIRTLKGNISKWMDNAEF